MVRTFVLLRQNKGFEIFKLFGLLADKKKRKKTIKIT